MKKMSRLFCAIIMVLVFLIMGGCATTVTEDTNEGATDAAQPLPEQIPDTANNILVAYFSHTGNTEALAMQIHDITGGDIFKIEPTEPYPEDYDECVAQAREEMAEGYLPPLKTEIVDITQYEVIFLGYPIWFGTIGPPLETFLSQYDLSGKTIVPFCTYGGSGLGESANTIAERCPQSTILEALAISRDSAESSHDIVLEWLHKLEMAE